MFKLVPETLLPKRNVKFAPNKDRDIEFEGEMHGKMYFHGKAIRFEFEINGVKMKEAVVSLSGVETELEFLEKLKEANKRVRRIYDDYEDGELTEQQLAKRLPDSNYAKKLNGGFSVDTTFKMLSALYCADLTVRYETKKTNTVTKSTLDVAHKIAKCKLFSTPFPNIRNNLLRKKALNQLTLKELSKKLFDDLIEYLLNDVENGDKKGYSLSYVKNIVDYIKQVFKTAIVKGIQLENVAKDLQTPKKQNIGRVTTADYFSKKEREAVYQACVDIGKPYLASMFKFGYSMGLRKEELLALAYEDIDFENKVVYVNRAYTAGRFGETKTELSARRIRLTDLALEALEEIQPFTLELPSVSYQVKRVRNLEGFVDEPLHLVFMNFSARSGQKVIGRNWTDKAIKIAWDAVKAESGVDKPLNLVRHTYATTLFSSGVSARRIARNLGHANESMVTQRYAEFSDEFDNDYMAQVNNAFG